MNLPGFPYCYAHKSDYEACFAQLKIAVRKEPGNEEHVKRLEEFEVARQTSGDLPPSKLSAWVLKFAQACPAAGRGMKRKTYEYATEAEMKRNATRTKTGVRAVKMHKEKFLRLATTDLDMTPEDALSQWEHYEKTLVDQKDRDKLGPPQSQLRLNVPVEDFTIGETETEHAKIVMLESAKKKIKSMKEVEDMQDRADTGHAAFSEQMFQSTGGSLMKAIAKGGLSSFLDASAASVFGNGAAASASGMALGQDLQLSTTSGDSEGKPAAKKKRYEIEFNREKLVTLCGEEVNKIKTMADEAMAKAATAQQVAVDCYDVVENLGRWQQILTTRLEFLKQAMMGSGEELVAEWTDEDDEYKQISDQLYSVEIAIKSVESEEHKASALLVVFASMVNRRGKCIAVKHQWNGEGFETMPPNYGALERDFKKLKNVRAAELHLKSFLETKAKQRLPAPIEDVALLLPLQSLAFSGFEAEICNGEDDVKSVAKNFNEGAKVFKALIGAVVAGTSQLMGHIERTQLKEASEKVKAEISKRKEAEKMEKQKKAAEDAEARKAGKNTSKSAAQSLTSQNPSIILTSDHRSITPMAIFKDEEEFVTWRAGKSTQDFEVMGPYVISEVTLFVTLAS